MINKLKDITLDEWLDIGLHIGVGGIIYLITWLLHISLLGLLFNWLFWPIREFLQDKNKYDWEKAIQFDWGFRRCLEGLAPGVVVTIIWLIV
jgi:hypothetical protein